MQIDGQDFIDNELDNLELNKIESKKATDQKFTYDFSHFPKTFKNIEDAVDIYN